MSHDSFDEIDENALVITMWHRHIVHMSLHTFDPHRSGFTFQYRKCTISCVCMVTNIPIRICIDVQTE